jgi:hypothetical protein
MAQVVSTCLASAKHIAAKGGVESQGGNRQKQGGGATTVTHAQAVICTEVSCDVLCS